MNGSVHSILRDSSLLQNDHVVAKYPKGKQGISLDLFYCNNTIDSRLVFSISFLSIPSL